MRYNSEDKNYAERDISKKHDVSKRLKRPRTIKPNTSGAKFISAEAVITSIPKNECTVFQKKARKNQTEHDFRKLNREEVTVTATLFTGAVHSSYVLRFVHKNSIISARQLITGQRIRIDKGYFNFRAGRKQSEFWVKSFAVISNYELQIPMSSHLKSEFNQQTETVIKQDLESAREESAAGVPKTTVESSAQSFCVSDFLYTTGDVQPVRVRHWLNQIGFGRRFHQDDFYFAQTELFYGRHAEFLNLKSQVDAAHDTFGKLREIARFIFSDGGRHFNSDWKREYEYGQWTNPAENPGLLADSWLATLSPEYRSAVACSLLKTVYTRVSDPDSKFFDERTMEAIEDESTENQIEISLSAAGIGFLQRTELPGHEWRFPLSPKTFAELCLYPLDLPTNFFPTVVELVRNKPETIDKFRTNTGWSNFRQNTLEAPQIVFAALQREFEALQKASRFEDFEVNPIDDF